MRAKRSGSSARRNAAIDTGVAAIPATITTRDALCNALALLDRLLALAVDKAARMLGPATLLDPWRGMHLDAEEVRRTLHAADPQGLGNDDAVGALAAPLLHSAQLARIAAVAGLTPLDLAIVAVVIAPDLDLRYERIYAYLQDDISRKRPSADLLANLLASSREQRLIVLGRLAASAPLMQAGVLQRSGALDVALLARPLQLASEWLEALTGEIAESVGAAPGRATLATSFDADVADAVATVLRRARETGRSPRLVLQGPDGSGKASLATLIAQALDLTVLALDLRDAAGVAELRALILHAANSALLRGNLVYLHGAGRLAQRDPQLARALHDVLAASTMPFILALNAPLAFAGSQPLVVDRIELRLPSAPVRAGLWSAALREFGVATAAADVETAATRFVLSAAQIRQAAADVRQQAARRAGGAATLADLAAAARALCGDELARLAQRVRPTATFAALVAAPEVHAQLRELCVRVALRDRVRALCGDGVHQRVIGVNALFAGPSGTGKTLAAEIIANELGLDLFRIDLSAIVSKYIGETEKNLDRVFTAAASANAVLFFDEADALFGKRSEVRDAHDRYANIEIAYLLQKIEQFDGVAILATNLKQNLDEAFTRRLTFSINFAFPEEAERARLWQTLWPPAAPRAPEVDFAALAREYRVSGGNIRNIVLASTYLAVADGGTVTREHVHHAARREFQKLGKTLAPAHMPRPAVA